MYRTIQQWLVTHTLVGIASSTKVNTRRRFITIGSSPFDNPPGVCLVGFCWRKFRRAKVVQLRRRRRRRLCLLFSSPHRNPDTPSARVDFLEQHLPPPPKFWDKPKSKSTVQKCRYRSPAIYLNSYTFQIRKLNAFTKAENRRAGSGWKTFSTRDSFYNRKSAWQFKNNSIVCDVCLLLSPPAPLSAWKLERENTTVRMCLKMII